MDPWHTQGCGTHMEQVQPTTDQKYLGKKIPENSKKTKLEFAALTTIHITFALCL